MLIVCIVCNKMLELLIVCMFKDNNYQDNRGQRFVSHVSLYLLHAKYV